MKERCDEILKKYGISGCTEFLFPLKSEHPIPSFALEIYLSNNNLPKYKNMHTTSSFSVKKYLYRQVMFSKALVISSCLMCTDCESVFIYQVPQNKRHVPGN